MGTLGCPLSHPPPTTQSSAHPTGVLVVVPPLLHPLEGSLSGPGRRGCWKLSWTHIPLTSRYCLEFLYPYLDTLPRPPPSCKEW